MRRWRTPLLLLVAAITLLAIVGGTLLLQPSGQAEAGIISGDSLSCSASGGSGDALVVAPDSTGTSLATTDTTALSATCYFAGITRFPGGCGGQDLYVLRYLCYDPARGWFYVNYAYCV
jgi:preprotein translocase subunit SecG